MRCLMCIYYLEDIWYALETVIQLEWFVKFKKKSMIFKPKYNAEMPRLVMQKPNHLPRLYWSALTHTVFFWGSWCKSVRIGPIRSVVLCLFTWLSMQVLCFNCLLVAQIDAQPFGLIFMEGYKKLFELSCPRLVLGTSPREIKIISHRFFLGKQIS